MLRVHSSHEKVLYFIEGSIYVARVLEGLFECGDCLLRDEGGHVVVAPASGFAPLLVLVVPSIVHDDSGQAGSPVLHQVIIEGLRYGQ